jgi:hypothetical protein
MWDATFAGKEITAAKLAPYASSFRGGSEMSEPGIHNHDREYGFPACAKWRIHDVQFHIGE